MTIYHTVPVKQYRKLKRCAGIIKFAVLLQLRLSSKWFSLVWITQRICRGIKFQNNEEDGQQHVRKFLHDAHKDLYATGFSQLLEQWELCIELKRDYVEK